ncbi:hypothetical protein AB7M22_001972 [Pseudomonas sp. ADAK2 TE3594]
MLLRGPLGPLWERACSRRRPDSRPVSCGCIPIKLWELACRVAASLRWRPDSRPGFLMVYISVAAVTAAYGFALTASPFWQTPQKEPKGLAPSVRPLAEARRSFASVSIWGHRPTVGFASTYMRWVRLRRTALRANPQMNTSTQPPEGAGRSRSSSRSKAEATAGSTASRAGSHSWSGYIRGRLVG